MSSLQMATALRSARVLALDAEWRPDGPHTNHAASLLQLALATDAEAERGEWSSVWLLDLESLTPHPALDAALKEALTSPRVRPPYPPPTPPLPHPNPTPLSSPKVRLLGYGLHTDVDKLALRCGWGAFDAGTRLCGVVDLRDACARASGRRGSSTPFLPYVAHPFLPCIKN